MTYEEPNDIVFARSPILYAVYDALYTNQDFQYTADVYIWQGTGGGTKPATPQYELAKYPEPNGTARFNVQDLVKDYLRSRKYTFSTENDTYLMYVHVAVTLNYKYGTSTVGTPIVLSDVIALDGYNYYLEGINYLPSTHLGNSSNSYWMTNRPLKMDIPTGTSMRMFLAKDSTAAVYQVVIDVNDGDFDLYIITSGLTNEIAAIKAGSTEIQQLATSGGDTDPITEYKIYGADSGGTAVTKVYEFTIEEPCKYGFKNLQFLNRYGVWDNLLVYGTKKESLDVKRTEVMTSPVDISTTPSMSLTEQQGQFRMANIHGRESMRVNTGWIDEDYNEVIKQMMLSEDLFDADTLQPYTIDTSSINFKTSLNNKLINYTFNLKQANTSINTLI